MPSVASLEKQQYYGYSRNAFWPLMAEILGFELSAEYASNVAQIMDKHIAIWDVIGECVRPGSLDSAIVKGSERLNPIAILLADAPGLTRIGLNGGTAAKLFKQHCLPTLNTNGLTIYSLPSTSPANARMSFNAKCDAWRPLIQR
jgi:TDG/mug DNA glycosylase family protein